MDNEALVKAEKTTSYCNKLWNTYIGYGLDNIPSHTSVDSKHNRNTKQLRLVLILHRLVLKQ